MPPNYVIGQNGLYMYISSILTMYKEASLFTLRQLTCFVAACEEGGIGNAATRLRLAQATVSGALADLERVLGVELLVRGPRRRAVVTPAGRQLLPRARVVLDAARQLAEQSAEIRGEVSGELPVGCLVTLAPVLAPRVFAMFEERWPEARPMLQTGDQETLLGLLRRGEIDLALTYDLGLDDRTLFEPLALYPPYCLLAADHSLARHPSLTLSVLADEPLVLLDLPLSRDYFFALFADAGVTPTVARRSGDPELVRSLVAHGFGYTLANALPAATQSVDGAPLRAVALAGDPRALSIGLARRAGVTLSRTGAAFADTCAAVLGGVPPDCG